MALEKRNTFLDVEDESDDGASQGYDSEADEIKKGGNASSGHASKRRRLSEDDIPSDAESDDDEDGGAALNGKSHRVDDRFVLAEEDEDDQGQNSDDDAAASSSKPKSKKTKTSTTDASTADPLPDVSRPLTKRNLVATEKAVKKSGLLYLSRIPPFMKPTKVRSLLEPHGNLNRIFLSPEDPAAHTRRVKSGGNKKRMFIDGWVEFVNKRDAKNAAALLNATPIGGKKGSYYRDDVWSCVYLKGFKWHHLTEQIAAEAAERQGRMRVEISKTTRENKEFLRNIERAKVEDGMEAKRKEQRKRRRGEGNDGDDDEEEDGGGGADVAPTRQSKRQFKQAAVRDRSAATTTTTTTTTAGDGEGKKQQQKTPDDAKRVLSKLF